MNIQSTSSTLNSKREAFLVFILVGYFIAFFLYYIDEGNYSFSGLARPIEWVFVSIYAFLLVAFFQLFFYFLKSWNWPNYVRIFLSVILGFALLAVLFTILTA